MKNLVIYGSVYGSSKRYAEKIAEILKAPICDYKNVTDTEEYKNIIYFGSLYAGGAIGLKEIIKQKKIDFNNQQFIIASVGLADPLYEENIINIKNSLKKVFEEDTFEKVKIFNLRGSVNYKELSVKHKIMMKALYLKISKKNENEKTKEDIDFINTYNTQVDFVDFDTLKPIINFINS